MSEATTIETFRVAPALAPILLRGAVAGRAGGDTLPTTRLRLVGHVVERGELAAYQRVCGFPVSDRLPHTYPHVVGFPLQAELMSRPGFPMPLAGLVHVENEITVHRALDADDALDITVHAEGLRAHPKGRQVDLVTVVEVDGEVVWEGRSTYLHRGSGDPDAERGAPMPTVASTVKAARWRLPGDLGRTYAGVSGDVNPIHLSSLTAKAMGFPRAIAHGMWTYAHTLASLGPRVDGPSTSHVWFVKPVLLPGSVDAFYTREGERTLAALRHPSKPDTTHLVLTLDPRA